MSQPTSAIKKTLAPNVSADNKAVFERAFKGDVKAMYTLGRMYDSGKYGLEPDEDKAIAWYQSAAALGHRDAMYDLAVLYWDSRYLPQFAELALEFFTKAANLKHGRAMFKLFVLLFKGEMVVQDKKLAFEWCQKAAEHGHFEAMICFAMMCERGEGVPKDKDKARKILKKVKGTRVPENMNELAAMLNEGRHKLEINLKTGWALRRKAAALGDPFALYSVATIYSEGSPEVQVKKNHAKAISLLEKAKMAALKKGDVLVMTLVGRFYCELQGGEHIKEGIPLLIQAARAGYKHAMHLLCHNYHWISNQTPEEATVWLKKAAKAGHGKAAFALAEMYDNQTNRMEVSQQDQAQAYFWYKKAAGKGHVEAMYEVAQCYRCGRGTSKNDKMAFYWWEKGASNGNVNAMFNLGSAYGYNIGTEKNEKLSFYWFKRAADSGDANGKYSLGLVYLEGAIGVAKDEEKAFGLIMEAAEGGSTEAMKRLKKMYEEGIGCEKNLEKAKMWEDKAQGRKKMAEFRRKVEQGWSIWDALQIRDSLKIPISQSLSSLDKTVSAPSHTVVASNKRAVASNKK